MTYNKIFQFTLVALRAILSTMDPHSPAAALGQRTLDLVEMALTFSGHAPSPLQAAMPENAFKGKELPPQPWTPADLLSWAEKQQFAAPVETPPATPSKAAKQAKP
jgi:hypothetical protein